MAIRPGGSGNPNLITRIGRSNARWTGAALYIELQFLGQGYGGFEIIDDFRQLFLEKAASGRAKTPLREDVEPGGMDSHTWE
jgi:hypothetical protein